MTALIIILFYFSLLLVLGFISQRLFRGTSQDYFVASRSIGPFLLLMSVFGTTMTAFALIGSTGESYRNGIGTYGKLASYSGLIHSAVFFVIGIRVWAISKRYGYVTQIQYFRDRFESRGLGYVLFPILVGLVIPYLLIGLLGAGSVVRSITIDPSHEWLSGGVPPWITGLVVSAVVLTYIFLGGLRSAAWANTFQTLVFMVTGIVTVWIISSKLGGPVAASEAVMNNVAQQAKLSRESIPPLQFMSYAFIPLSVGMFPHIFQHWLTARHAKSFRLALIAHPLFIMIVWVPCVLIGVWATSAIFPEGHMHAGELIVPLKHPPNAELAIMVKALTSPVLAGLLAAGILAAIMSSLDSQFLCLGTMFTNDIVFHAYGEARFSEKQKILLARGFVVAIVIVTYLLSLMEPRQVFKMGVWCFTGFGSLFPLVFAALYWKRVTRAGAYACVLLTAITWFALFAKSGYGKTYLLLTDLKLMPATLTFAVSVVSLVVVSLFTKPPSEKTIKRFFMSS
jgi:SSS family solute:Na+ symporter